MMNSPESMDMAAAGLSGASRGGCSLWPESPPWAAECAALAERFGLPVAAPGSVGVAHCLLLGERSALLANAEPRGRPLSTVFDAAIDTLPPRFRNPGAANEALLRAIGVRQGRRPTVIDATAGLAVDALLMAAAGCEVRMIERSLPLLIMLERGLSRWLRQAELCRVASRLALCPR
jgi:16S rRNA (guanine1516-N2)-methyltransferase